MGSCHREGHRSQPWAEKGWGRSGQGCVCCLLSSHLLDSPAMEMRGKKEGKKVTT